MKITNLITGVIIGFIGVRALQRRSSNKPKVEQSFVFKLEKIIKTRELEGLGQRTVKVIAFDLSQAYDCVKKQFPAWSVRKFSLPIGG